jgi:hypothetical protein
MLTEYFDAAWAATRENIAGLEKLDNDISGIAALN